MNKFGGKDVWIVLGIASAATVFLRLIPRSQLSKLQGIDKNNQNYQSKRQ